MPRAGPRPASRCCSRDGAWALGMPGVLAGEVRSGRDVPDRRPRREGSSAGSVTTWRFGPMPRSEGLAGQAFSPSAVEGVGATEAGRAVRTRRFAWWDPTASRWPAHGWRRRGCTRPERLSPARRSRRPTHSPTCSRPSTDADGKGEIQGCRAEDIDGGPGRSRRVRFPDERARRGCGRRPSDHAEARRPADRPRSGRRSVRGAGPGGHRPDAAARIGRLWPCGPRAARRPMPKAASRSRPSPPASSRSTCSPPRARSSRPKLPADLAIEPGKTTEVTIPLEGPPRERTVAGRVVDRDRPARRRRHRVPVGRFLGPNRSHDRRGWAIHLERRRRAADVPVRPEAGLPLRRPRHRGRVGRRDARDPQGGRAAPARAEDAPAPLAPPGRNRAGAPPARPLRRARPQTGRRGGEGAHPRSPGAHRARARARADPAEEGVHGPVLQRHGRPATGHRPDGRERRRSPGGAGGAGRRHVEGDRVHRREQEARRPQTVPGRSKCSTGRS